LNFKASEGQVLGLCCYNANGADRFIQLFNKTTGASAAEVPYMSFVVKAGQQALIGKDFFGENGIHFTLGVTFGFSTTRNTYTAGAAGDQLTQLVIV
jgi:hypothetical protein